MARQEAPRPIRRIESLHSVETRAKGAIENPPFWKPSELASQLSPRATEVMKQSNPEDKPKHRRIHQTMGDAIIESASMEIADEKELAAAILLARSVTDQDTGMFQGLTITFTGDNKDIHAFSQNKVNLTHDKLGTIPFKADELVGTIKDATWKTYGADELLTHLVFRGGVEVLPEKPEDTIWRKGKELLTVRHEKLGGEHDKQLLQMLDVRLSRDLLRYWADVKKGRLQLGKMSMTATAVTRSSNPKNPYVELVTRRGNENILLNMHMVPGNINGMRLQIRGVSASLDSERRIR